MIRYLVLLVLASTLFFGMNMQPVEAHAFAQRYDLPIPLWLYLLAAGLTVFVSFFVIVIFVTKHEKKDGPILEILDNGIGRLFVNPYFLKLLRFLSVIFFLLAISSGLFGAQNIEKNLLPTSVWVIWWVGFAFLSAIIGDLWYLLNPWRIIAEWASAAFPKLKRYYSADRFSIQSSNHIWFAVVIFIGFAWAELVWPDRAVPKSLAIAVMLYSFVTWIGMYFIGIDNWLRRGEAFTILYGLFARFSRAQLMVISSDYCSVCDSPDCHENSEETCTGCYSCFRRSKAKHRRIFLRPYGAGLLNNGAVHISTMVFVILVLSTVSFDGFADTPTWQMIFSSLLNFPIIRNLTELLDLNNSITIISTIGIAATPIIFFLVYFLFCYVVSVIVRNADQNHLPSASTQLRTIGIACVFVFTLVPIAIAYHLAHFLSFLLIYGQQIIPLISDPFGYGWNLLGTATYEVDIAIVGAEFAWYTAVLAIVVGHVVAVYLSHIMALRVFSSREIAIRTQYPLLVLMIFYTVMCLWILAQPIVEL